MQSNLDIVFEPLDMSINYFNYIFRYIIVNLKRANGDLRVPSNNDPKGLFEIAGFDENTPKVIKALAENAFS